VIYTDARSKDIGLSWKFEIFHRNRLQRRRSPRSVRPRNEPADPAELHTLGHRMGGCSETVVRALHAKQNLPRAHILYYNKLYHHHNINIVQRVLRFIAQITYMLV